MDFSEFESLIEAHVLSVSSSDDPAHDGLHFKRVVATATSLCQEENAVLEIVLPAAWLHDLVLIPKNDPLRSQASRKSAEAAIHFLREIHYPEEFLAGIAHAIAAHSFSAEIPAETIEAKIVQDADRLDGLGAIGIARCFATAGLLKRSFYSEEDPFCHERTPNDRIFTLDHFFAKLFRTAETLQTESGRKEGARRVAAMRRFLADLESEISHS